METILNNLSKELNLPKEDILEIYKSYWRYIKRTIESFNLKDNLTEEEFYRLKPNFNIAGLGKLGVSYDRYKRIKKRHDKYKKDKT